MDCKPQYSSSTEGAISLLHWFEKVEPAFATCNCPMESRVKFAAGVFEDIMLSSGTCKCRYLGWRSLMILPGITSRT
ncbi:hypothetical protein Hanom_Chr00s000007g01614811 [Helianthus anomalus]